jgi:glycosyltransferase involved in cell wall biosynthesis
VDPEIFHPPAVPRTGEPVHLAYVGRLVKEKGVDLLLEALTDLPGRWRLTILGSGPQEERLRALAQRDSLRERVRFRALIPSLEMPAFYQSVDVLVLPSRSRPNWTEQFGRVLIEAMACGAAVVGSEAGEIPNVMGDAGLAFPEEDGAALRALLARLVTDGDLRRALGARGRVRVLEHFTQRRIAADTVAVYREMMT